MRIVLVGAGNRVQMVTHILESVRRLGVSIELISVESSERVPISQFVPIQIFTGSFRSPEFIDFLKIFGGQSDTLVVPFMDSAAQAIGFASAATSINSPSGPWVNGLSNKKTQKQAASLLGIPVPSTASQGWAHVRPAEGNGSKGTAVVWLNGVEPEEPDVLHEEIVPGLEISLDVYVDQQGQSRVSARDRLRITGGEVQHTTVREPTKVELSNALLLVESFKLRGPCNLQFIGSPSKFLEVNPRFGGGSTASVEAGWKAWDWLIREYLLGQKIDECMKLEPLEMKRAWKDYYWRQNGDYWN